jgi:hypothetical protein
VLIDSNLKYIQLGIRCFTPEQVETVLKRAKSAALRLYVEWPTDEETPLDVISSRRCLIESLTIRTFGDEPITDSDRIFSALNLASLKRIQLIYLDTATTVDLLQTISRSINGGVALTLVEYTLPALKQLLQHPINQRITSLCIASGMNFPVMNFERSKCTGLFHR